MREQPSAALHRGMKWKTRGLAVFFSTVCLGGLIFRLWTLQVTDYEFYAQKAADQQLRDTVIAAPRGDILDANGKPLAVSASCWTVRAVPREMADEHVQEASRVLAEILELEEQDVLEKLSDRKSNDKLLRRRVNREMADAVQTACAEHGWQGILLIQDTKRWYPEGDFGASFLGFTNVDNQGVSGLELEYNSQLTGQDGLVLSAKNAWGYTMPTDYDTHFAPVKGNDLHLTINVNVQHYLETALSYAVQEHNVTARGVGIVMEVDTGRILAISTKPDYDPNEPRVIADSQTRQELEQLSGEEKSQALQLAQQLQWRNKAVSDLYEPGSVFKLITASAALDAGVVSQNSVFHCGKSYSVSGIAFHCANHKKHGAQTLTNALENSCNQSFIQIGQLLGKEAYADYFAAFGLRVATGIDLPAEPKKSEFYTADRMGPVELASCSFGQSNKITPIQMITAVSAVVNGGRLMQPYLVEKITDPEGDVIMTTQPQVKDQVISEETSAVMRQMMESVVNNGGGKNAYVAGYRVGGKSGTSQKLDSEDESARIASFVGVAPMDDPKIAVLIVLDEPHHLNNGGGALAAPVVAQVLEQTLEYYGEERQYTEEEQENRLATLPGVEQAEPEQAQKDLMEAGFATKIVGDGAQVLGQYPAAGQSLPRGSTVVLYTEEGWDTLATVVPAVTGQTLEQAQQTLLRAGLNLRVTGPYEDTAVVLSQGLTAGEQVQQGTVVSLSVGFLELPEDGDSLDD